MMEPIKLVDVSFGRARKFEVSTPHGHVVGVSFKDELLTIANVMRSFEAVIK